MSTNLSVKMDSGPRPRCHRLKPCRVWTFNKRQLQSVVSRFCGYYCYFFCLFRCRNVDMINIFKHFSRDTALNDSIVHSFICANKWSNSVLCVLLLMLSVVARLHFRKHAALILIHNSKYVPPLLSPNKRMGVGTGLLWTELVPKAKWRHINSDTEIRTAVAQSDGYRAFSYAGHAA